MEQELKKAGSQMPLPKTTFENITAHLPQNSPVKRPVPRLAVIALVLLLGFTLSAGAYRYSQVQRGMWIVMGYESLSAAHTDYLDHYDLVMPETLDGCEFIGISEWSVVDQGVGQLQAMLTRFYRPIALGYSDDTRTRRISIDIGTTQHGYWKKYFSINEDGIHETRYDITDTWQTVAYRGCEIQLTLRQYSRVHAHALWIDNTRNICISMDVDSEDVNDALNLARQIIDLNME